MSEKETLSDGKRITRDEYGRFQTVELSSEAARAMARSKLPNKARYTTSTTLLQEAGYTPESAPEHLKLLSEIAASKRASSVSALRDFRKLTQPERSEPAPSNMREVKPFFDDSYDYVELGAGGVMGLYARVPGRQISELVRELQELDAGG